MSTETVMLQTPAPHTVPSTPPLVLRLLEQFGARWFDQAAGSESESGDSVLFIPGDAVRFPECLDVAAVLPELQRHFAKSGSNFQISVAASDSEDKLANQFGAQRRPSLIFLRDGRYVGTVAGMLDWDDFIREFAHLLESPVSRAPTVGIPVKSANSTQSHCH